MRGTDKMVQRIRAAAVIVENNKILLVKHVHPSSGFEWWVPPGGGLESFDNSIYDCAIRETWEESGYRIEVNDILFIREFMDKENDTLNLEIFLQGNVIDGDLTINHIQGNGPDEHFIKDVRWIHRNEVANITVFPEIIKEKMFWDKNNSAHLAKYLGRQEG